MKKILVIHGPNLNLLGLREPDIYGSVTLAEIDEEVKQWGREHGFRVECFQSNSEGGLVDKIQNAAGKVDALIINPAAYTHTSVALRDVLLAVKIPAIEVHISNIHGREEFRRTSLIGDVVQGQIAGFGVQSYILGLQAARHLIGPDKK